MKETPTERLVVTYPAEPLDDIALAEHTNAQLMEFALKLQAEGKRPWFEVFYPGTTEETFDAMELLDGQLYTLPPYNEPENTAAQEAAHGA